MTAGVLINYLPAHMVYRTPKMQRIYDGFLPMSNGAMIRDVDVPMIHVPTMHEVSGNITNKQDSDEPGKQYRLYEFSGHGAHRHARQRADEAQPVRAAAQHVPGAGVHVGGARSSVQVGGQGHGAAARRPHPARSQRGQRRLDDGARRARQSAWRDPHDLRGRADGDLHDPARGDHARRSRTPARTSRRAGSRPPTRCAG